MLWTEQLFSSTIICLKFSLYRVIKIHPLVDKFNLFLSLRKAV